MNSQPEVILVLSGKRKSGKDFIAEEILKSLGTENSTILRLSEPIKREYALKNNLDYEKLLDSSDYKENFRSETIAYGENIRSNDPGYFCRIVVEKALEKKKDFWIVSDARRMTDLDYFFANYPSKIVTIRIEASDEKRTERGFKYKSGIDDAESECGLDNYDKWDAILQNNGPEIISQLKEELDRIMANKKVQVEIKN